MPLQPSPVDTPVWSALDEAQRRISAGQYQAVIAELDELYKKLNDSFTRARCALLLADAYLQQKIFKGAKPYMMQAEADLDLCQCDDPTWYSLKIDCVMTKAWVIYFNIYHEQNLDDCLNELNELLLEYGNSRQRKAFFAVVSLGMLKRYQWNNLPPEAITHSRYSYELARQENDKPAMVSVLGELGMMHMFRNETKTAIKCFADAVELCGDAEIGFKIISTNYISVCYRMMNKVAECAEWAQKTITISQAHHVGIYEHMGMSNMAWVHLKRGNQLEAEHLAELSYHFLNRYQHPFLWLPAMPLMYYCAQRADWRQAGSYALALYIPPRKRLPESMEAHSVPMLQAWFGNDGDTCLHELRLLLQEAELTGHL